MRKSHAVVESPRVPRRAPYSQAVRLGELVFVAGQAGDSNAQRLAKFTDIHELQRQLKAQGVELQQSADESTSGPASLHRRGP